MGPYRYQSRVARLRQRGARLHEFGERTLQQGSFGDDVMQLQVGTDSMRWFLDWRCCIAAGLKGDWRNL